MEGKIRAVIFDMYETLVTQLGGPLYFGTQIAGDLGLPPEAFLPGWRDTEALRTVGKLTFEEVIELLMHRHGVYAPELYRLVIEKRKAVQRGCFDRLHPQILPMLQTLKTAGIKIGLITNCFSEEAALIRESELFSYFDAACISWELGIRKPDPDIFDICLERLGIPAEHCLYVGDGGSRELETAASLGLQAVQAVWYRQEAFANQQAVIRPEFRQIAEPMEIVYEAQVAREGTF